MFISTTFGQNPSQTVRGTITDIDSKLPLIGVAVAIISINPQKGTVTDASGVFRFEQIPIGRITIEVSSLGYEYLTVSDIVVNSGKEIILNLSLKETVFEIDEIVVKPPLSDSPLNPMAMISSRSISVEETKRFSGSWDDPSRLLSNFAGVTTSANGNNDIIVRGNSPKYIQWRLEDVTIFAPNHQADQNMVVAGFSCLNNRLLAASDFYTAAFSAEYGNVLSGVYNVKFREGNNEKFEAMLGVGLLGTDFTIEAPLKKGYEGSYIINYRFSNIGLLQKLNLIDIEGINTTFQDVNFKVVLPTEKIGKFSVFGVLGLDNLYVDDLKPSTWVTPGNNEMMPEIIQYFDKNNFLANVGVSHILNINSGSYLKTSVIYSETGMDEDIYESNISSPDTKNLNYSSWIKASTYTGAIKYNNKINSRNTLQTGSEFSLINEKNLQSQLENSSTANRFTLIDYHGNIGVLQNYATWKHNLSDKLSFVAGLHNMNVILNKKSTIEPRVSAVWRMNSTNAISAGYGKHSTMESIHNYFTLVKSSDGTITEPNKDLDLLKSDHFVFGYSNNISQYLKFKMEVYYQNLYNLPVENDPASYYSTINEGTDYRFVSLVNKGVGKNYGVEATIEKFFSNNYYFLINASVFDSKYKTLENVERNTKFNNNFVLNALGGREFDKLGKKRNQTLSLNTKIFFSGGQRYIPLLRDVSGNLTVNPQNNEFWDYNKAYGNKFENIFQLNLSVSYKINKQRVTHEIYLDLPNITNNKAKVYEYYDENEPDKTGYIRQMELLPNFMYRLYF